MTLTDANLADLLARLTPAERRAVEDALKGDRSVTAAEILRWIRRRLKRKARAGKRSAQTSALGQLRTTSNQKKESEGEMTDNERNLNDARDYLRAIFAGGEHWLFIVDGPATAVVSRIASRYYDGAETADFAAVPAMVNGDQFTVVVARKRRMPGYKLNSLLRQMTRARMTDREVVARDLFVIAEPRRLDAGTNLAAALFDDPEAERTGAGDVPALNGGLAVAA